MKTQSRLKILFLPLLLLFIQSCGNEKKPAVKKDKQIDITATNVSAIFSEQTSGEDQYVYATGFDDETRSQSSNYENYDVGYNTYQVSYTTSGASTANGTVSFGPKTKSTVKKGKKIVKNGTLRIKTDAFDGSKKRIDRVVKSLNGYYENEELDKTDTLIQYRLIIRLPSKNFEQLVKGIETGKDEIVFKKVNVNDVTEEFLDIETRLENKRKYLKRYKELLEKAKNVQEILSIEENIRQLMEEIESKEGRLKYLNDQVDLSTLRINLFKEYPAKINKPAESPFSSKAGDSLGKGWNSIINFLLWTVSKWPVILLIGIVVWIARRKWKKRKAENK